MCNTCGSSLYTRRDASEERIKLCYQIQLQYLYVFTWAVTSTVIVGTGFPSTYQDLRPAKSCELDRWEAGAPGGTLHGVDTPEEGLHVPVTVGLSLHVYICRYQLVKLLVYLYLLLMMYTAPGRSRPWPSPPSVSCWPPCAPSRPPGGTWAGAPLPPASPGEPAAP